MIRIWAAEQSMAQLTRVTARLCLAKLALFSIRFEPTTVCRGGGRSADYQRIDPNNIFPQKTRGQVTYVVDWAYASMDTISSWHLPSVQFILVHERERALEVGWVIQA
jgi:hypothetical protein